MLIDSLSAATTLVPPAVAKTWEFVESVTSSVWGPAVKSVATNVSPFTFGLN